MINLVMIKTNMIKGINIDLKIIKKVLEDLSYITHNIFIKYKNIKYYAKHNGNKNKYFDLSGEIYIFSEVMLPELFAYLLNNNKKIIIVPNIDSYSSYRNDNDFLYFLKCFSKISEFHVWAKTTQIKNWLKSHNINSFFINFCFYSRNKIVTHKKIKNNLLLDTGSSETKRKYCNKIITLFDKKSLFKLTVKTTDNIFKLNNLKKFKNTKIINNMMTDNDINKLYDDHNFSIYLSKYDGYGLYLAKAIESNHFIFCNNGLPWNELLQNYPRKVYIKC